MRRFALTTVAGAAVALIAAAGWAADAPAQGPRNIILIGWDGCQRSRLQAMVQANQVPNLIALGKSGALVNIDATSGATDSRAGWAQILTGYTPQVTGVYSNARYQAIPPGDTVFERLKTALGKDFITMAVVGKADEMETDGSTRIPYNQWFADASNRMRKRVGAGPGTPKLPPGSTVVGDGGQEYVVMPAKPWHNAAEHMDLCLNGLGSNDRVGTTALSELGLVRDKRFFAFVDFGMADVAGSKYGVTSQQYTDAIKSDDAWLGKIVTRLRDLGLYDQTLIYVTSDHGFDVGKKTHRYAPYVFLGTNDKQVMRDGIRSDIGATILERFGIDVAAIAPPLDGIPLDQAAPERKAPATPPWAGKHRRAHVRVGHARGRRVGRRRAGVRARRPGFPPPPKL